MVLDYSQCLESTRRGGPYFHRLLCESIKLGCPVLAFFARAGTTNDCAQAEKQKPSMYVVLVPTLSQKARKDGAPHYRLGVSLSGCCNSR